MSIFSRRAFGASTLALAAAGLLALTGCASSGDRPAANVLQLAAQTPELSTFTKLVQQAGLSASLEAAGPVTVFAPTDEAFKAVPAATMDKLGKDPEALKSVLRYHIVPGLVKSTDIAGATPLTTVHGGKIAAARAGDFVTADDALVIKANQPAGNGVVHTIDRVLTPPKK